MMEQSQNQQKTGEDCDGESFRFAVPLSALLCLYQTPFLKFYFINYAVMCSVIVSMEGNLQGFKWAIRSKGQYLMNWLAYWKGLTLGLVLIILCFFLNAWNIWQKWLSKVVHFMHNFCESLPNFSYNLSHFTVYIDLAWFTLKFMYNP